MMEQNEFWVEKSTLQDMGIDFDASLARREMEFRALQMEQKVYVDPAYAEFEERGDHLHVILSPKPGVGNVKMRLILNKEVMKQIVLKVLE